MRIAVAFLRAVLIRNKTEKICYLLILICCLVVVSRLFPVFLSGKHFDSIKNSRLVKLRQQLRFLPVKDRHVCDNLFPGGEKNTDKTETNVRTIIEDFQAVLDSAQLEKEKTTSVDGCQPPILLSRVLRAASRLKFVRHVCDVGFGAGFNVLTFLSAVGHSDVISFALHHSPFTAQMQEYLSAEYPGRLTLLNYTHEKNVTDFFRHPTGTTQKRPATCDLIFFGGCHSNERRSPHELKPIVFKQLLRALVPHLSRENLVIVDETAELHDSWSDVKEVYNITELLRCKYHDGDVMDRGVTIGTLLKR